MATPVGKVLTIVRHHVVCSVRLKRKTYVWFVLGYHLFS